MRLPQPEILADPILDLLGKRVVVILDGVKIRGKLISARDGFLCIEPYNGPRVSINKWEISSISLDAPQ